MQCPSCAAPASEGQSHCAHCHTSLSALAGAYAAPTSSTEKTIMFDRAPWPQPEEPADAWTPGAPPAGRQAEAPAQAPPPGEATEWWTPAADDASGPTPLPQQSAWAPAAEPVPPQAPAAPVVPDSWFAGPVQEPEAAPRDGELRQAQTGPFTPVFDDAPERPAPAVDSTFASVGMPEPPRPDGHDPDPLPGAPAAEPPGPAQNGLAAAPPYAQPEYVQPEYAQPAEYGRPEYVQPGPVQSEYAQPEQPLPGYPPQEPAQPHALAAEPSYGAPRPDFHGQPQQGFAPPPPGAPQAPGGFQQPPAWDAPYGENPWNPGGQPPMAPPPQPAPAGGGAKNKPLIIGVAALVAAAVASVAFVFLNDDDGKKAPKPAQTVVAQQPDAESKPVADPAAVRQARQVQALLNASAKSRGALGSALVKARKCAGLPGSITVMEQVAQQRRQQWQQARRLDVSALPQGAQLRSSLSRSFKLSLDVDLAYLSWARNNRGCKGKTPAKGASYKRGATLSVQATRAKNRFLQLWNPMAPKYGLSERKSF